MARYRAKPVVIEAVKYLGAGNIDGGAEGVPDWIWAAFADGTLGATDGGDPLIIKNTEEERVTSPGDWIIMDFKGGICPCKPDIFEMTYEKEAHREKD